jgi:hypothetical protein
MSPDEQSALLSYTQETPPEINLFIRGTIPLESNDKKRFYLDMVNSLSHHLYPSHSLVYRGIPSQYSPVGCLFEQPFLISTTNELSNALHFTSDHGERIVLAIKVPAGTPFTSTRFLNSEYKSLILETDGYEDVLLPGKLNITRVQQFGTSPESYHLYECDYSILESLQELHNRVVRTAVGEMIVPRS